MPNTQNTEKQRFRLAYDELENQRFFKKGVEFGEKIGVTGQMVSQLKTGKASVGLQIIKKMCEAYPVRLEFMMYGVLPILKADSQDQPEPINLIENRLEKQIAIMYKRILANEERLLQVEQRCHEQRTKQV